MKVNRLTLLVSILAIVLSVIAISTSCQEPKCRLIILDLLQGVLAFL